jgi:hypothetical protein
MMALAGRMPKDIVDKNYPESIMVPALDELRKNLRQGMEE